MCHHARRLRSLLTLLAMAAFATAAAHAHADPLGLYVGAGVGESQVKLDSVGFNESHAGWKALVGLRPLPVFAAELEYIDFGHPTQSFGPANAHVRGAALSALLYAPLPTSIVDLYAKGGFSRLQTTGSGTLVGVGTCTVGSPNCGLFSFDRTDTRFAFGAGAQVKLSSLAIRGEYQRFSSEVGNPTFWSVALTWSF